VTLGPPNGVRIVHLQNENSATAWAKAWEDYSTSLFGLLKGLDRDTVESLAKLLARIQECREVLGDPPDARLRRLWRGVLAELWEAARAALYGDLEPAREHAFAARRLERELREILETFCA
jgi:hypothetical protein